MIQPKFNFDDVRKKIARKVKNIEKAIIQNLKTLGEMCVKVARENGNYIDQTGNLRSSIGYVLLANGVIVSENFQSAVKDENNNGVNTGKQFALKLAQNYPNDFVLIVVAGMKYAAAVESRSRDVLSSSEIFAKKELPKMINQLEQGIYKMRA